MSKNRLTEKKRRIAAEPRRRREASVLEEECPDESIALPSAAAFPDVAGKSLDEVLGAKEDTF